ncbi:MAG: large conductance mechanosensitive channel protein MscL [Verrucomicrobiales bacterium]
MVTEFKDFIVKGNPIDLAVGVLIGGAFGKVVSAVTDGLVKPILGAIGGNPNVSLKLGILDIGMVLNSIIGLVITGAILFFLFVKPMNKMRAMQAAKEAPPPPAGPTQEQLLAEIRDLLRK